jgi:hypothetical protein
VPFGIFAINDGSSASAGMLFLSMLDLRLDVSLKSCSSGAGIAQLVEQLICNQQVAGSSPVASSSATEIEESWLSGQKQQTVNLPGLALRRFKSSTLHHLESQKLEGRRQKWLCAAGSLLTSAF